MLTVAMPPTTTLLRYPTPCRAQTAGAVTPRTRASPIAPRRPRVAVAVMSISRTTPTSPRATTAPMAEEHKPTAGEAATPIPATPPTPTAQTLPHHFGYVAARRRSRAGTTSPQHTDAPRL